MGSLLIGILAIALCAGVVIGVSLLLEEGKREGLIKRGYVGEDDDS